MAESAGDRFLLYSPDVIPKLREREFFCDALAQYYTLVGNQHGCDVTLSYRRLAEAHDYWLGDEERTLHNGTDEETTQLDHFKHAAFIAFWLRRLVPINDINFIGKDGERPDPDAATPRQTRFYRYGNEFCALTAGFYICLAYEVAAKKLREGGGSRVVSEVIGVSRLPTHFVSEYPKLLKHKNMSPHALYMLYRSAFDSLVWQIGGRPPEAA